MPLIALTKACSVLPERQISTVVTRTIPVLPKPVRIDMESPPQLSLTDPVIVLSRQDAIYYEEACTAFESVGQEGFKTLEEVQLAYPELSEDDVCNFSVFGFTLQGWLNLESTFIELATYVEKLRSHIRYLENLMDERQKLFEEHQKASIEELQSSRTVEFDQIDED